MLDVKEKDRKVTVTIGLIAVLVISSFFVGMLWEKNQSLHTEVELSKSYTEQEVSGLRADWERQNKIVKQEIEQLEQQHKELKSDINSRIDRKIKNHEQIYHK